MGGNFRYFGWYSNTGHTELITRQTVNDLRHWHNVRKKPMVITEYGADTVAGLHQVIYSSRTFACGLQFYMYCKNGIVPFCTRTHPSSSPRSSRRS